MIIVKSLIKLCSLMCFEHFWFWIWTTFLKVSLRSDAKHFRVHVHMCLNMNMLHESPLSYTESFGTGNLLYNCNSTDRRVVGQAIWATLICQRRMSSWTALCCNELNHIQQLVYVRPFIYTHTHTRLYVLLSQNACLNIFLFCLCENIWI